MHDAGPELLEAAVVWLGEHGSTTFSLHQAAAAAAAATPDELRLAARRAAPRALQSLAAGAAYDDRIRRLYGVWRPWLERQVKPENALSEPDALRARVEERLARIVAAMEAAYEAGDEQRAQLLHARYIELGVTHAGRLHGEAADAAR